jgi:hypothetical protein
VVSKIVGYCDRLEEKWGYFLGTVIGVRLGGKKIMGYRDGRVSWSVRICGVP